MMKSPPEPLVKDILKHRPVLLLNKSRHALSLINDLVHRHLSLVTSKGGKAFPLGVWDMIIAAGLEEPREDEYALVRPRAALDNGALICDAYDLTSIPAFERNEHYSKLLAADECFLDRLEAKSLDGCETNEETVRKGETFTVDLEGIRNQRKSYEDILSVYIELPDIMSRLEYGQCGFCGGDRELVAGNHGSWVCVGDSYTRDALEVALEEDEITRSEDMQWTEELDEAYEKKWEILGKSVEGRLKELGYLD